MFVTQMAFHARISDPAIGGTYMTLLNTICNLGANWPGTMALWFLDPLTDKSCQGGNAPNLDCDTTVQFEVHTYAFELRNTVSEKLVSRASSYPPRYCCRAITAIA